MFQSESLCLIDRFQSKAMRTVPGGKVARSNPLVKLTNFDYLKCRSSDSGHALVGFRSSSNSSPIRHAVYPGSLL